MPSGNLSPKLTINHKQQSTSERKTSIMSFCGKCGQQINEGAKFCAACGTPANTSQSTESLADHGNPAAMPPQTGEAEEQAALNQASGTIDELSKKLGGLNNTADSTASFSKKDIEDNKVMALLSYLGILVAIPILAAKNSPFARFHANQGLILCIAWIGWAIFDSVITAMLWALLWKGMGLWSIYSLCGTLLSMVYIVFTVLAVIGIINVLNGKAKELPLIGKFKILK